MDQVFGVEQLPWVPDGDPFNNVASSSDSEVEPIDHDSIDELADPICLSDSDSLSCGSYSDFTDIDTN